MALKRVKEYRKLLASLPDESVGVAVACFMLSSIHHKMAWAKAMEEFENEPGFARWGTVKNRPSAGNPAVAVRVPRSSRERGTR